MDKLLIITNKEELVSVLNDVLKDKLNLQKENSKDLSKDEKEISKQIKLLSIDDVCKLFSVSRVTLNKWKKQGLIPYKKMSRRVFFVEDDIYKSITNYNFKNINKITWK